MKFDENFLKVYTLSNFVRIAYTTPLSLNVFGTFIKDYI